MKTSLVTLLAFTFIGTCLFASSRQVTGKPVVAQMVSMIEGQIQYEAPLNSEVKKGQLVEKVDTAQYEAQVDADQAAIDYCKLIYNADGDLVKTHSISKLDYFTAKKNLRTAIDTQKTDRAILEHCSIYSPFDGIVTDITTYAGSGIGDGNLIMEITKK